MRPEHLGVELGPGRRVFCDSAEADIAIEPAARRRALGANRKYLRTMHDLLERV
ncbi:MAG: hypothetical protein MZU79_06290 [Anaerotruncus sp.]|nr:hypothetical protein [Anaerotruncus sp.]